MQDAESSVTEIPRDNWSIDDRGYIQGGYDTPIFLSAKKKFNSRHTVIRNMQKRIEQVRKEPGTFAKNIGPIFVSALKDLKAIDSKPFIFRPSTDYVLATGHQPIIKEQNA